MQLLHDKTVRFDDRERRRRWCRTPFVQRGRTAAQGAGTLGRAVPQPPARGQHAAPRGRGRRTPAARRPRAPVAVAHVHPARTGRQPKTGTAIAAAAPSTVVANNVLLHRRRRHHDDGTTTTGHHFDLVAASAHVFGIRVQQLIWRTEQEKNVFVIRSFAPRTVNVENHIYCFSRFFVGI